MTALSISPEMKTPLIFSAALHLGIVILSLIGLPFLTPDPIDTPINTISIEFISPDELTAAEKPEKPEPPKPEPEPDKPQAAPQMTADTPPDLSKEVIAPPKDEKPPEAEPETVPNPQQTNAKPLPKKPKPPKPEITRKAPEQQQKNFQSLLKNLTPDADEEKPKPADEGENDNNISNLADQLTFSEIDTVQSQLAGCWNVLSGAQYAENLVVRVKLFMNPDRTVRKATIVDTARYNSDSFYRAAADSALRALRNPNCSPLRLPEGKYNEWKTTIINFDPREML